MHRGFRCCLCHGVADSAGLVHLALEHQTRIRDRAQTQSLVPYQRAGSCVPYLGFLAIISSVFLDRACIHQGDARLKAEGIFNLAAFLKASKSLVVVFDESYLSRAWCVFELAAFIKSHEGESPPPVVIKHIAVAPTTAFLIITIALLNLYFSCLPAAGYLFYILIVFMMAFAISMHIMLLRIQRDTLKAENDFKSFRWDACTCQCCSSGHERDGVAIPCDKEILAECIARWFG
ncbi:unnamed protein product [Symbiodinium sp. CCMP2592]|nr:unnamed protein product [Symbiodinium sp. CCMP2592]